MIWRGLTWLFLVGALAVVHSVEEFLVSLDFDDDPTTTATTTTTTATTATSTAASTTPVLTTTGSQTTLETTPEVLLSNVLGTLNETKFVESHLANLLPRRNRTRGVGLFPVVFNLASRAKISSNATCGEEGPETYCKLVQHVLRRPTKRIQCGTCDANSLNPQEHHPIDHAIDGSNRWWQSPPISNGIRFHSVTITIDLGQVYQVAYVIIKAANSPRPGNWILERSLDGSDYQPWQYFALSDSECWNMYNMAPTIGIPRLTSDDDVICTSAYSRLDPLENGEIHTSLVNDRPGVDGPSDLLQEFTSARFIRLRLQRIRTLNADLMTFMSNDPLDLDPSVTNRYFYSIKDISVGGQCICYGHARRCPVNPETGELHCECEKGTCGRSCEECCPMFNQQPWQQGTYTDGGGCEECVCFGHAESCAYNQTIADRRLSLNLYGEYDGGGLCVNCQHNTMGVNCELCADGYYRPQGVDHRRPDACLPCDCDTHGATGHCVKDDSHVLDGFCAGDCTCNEGFTGPKCSECAPGWRGYPACEQCPCSPAGSLNVDTCEGDCICKDNTCGPFCDECLPSFYNLQTNNPVGCDPCFCFGVADVCDSLPWGRTLISNTQSNWTVTDLAGRNLVTPTREDGHLVVEGGVISPRDHVRYWSAPWQYTGNKLLSYGGQMTFTFHYVLKENITEIERQDNYLANSDVVIEGSGLRMGHSGGYYRETMDTVITINMTEHGWRHLDGSSSDVGALVARGEFLTVLTRLDRLLFRATYHLMQTSIRLKTASMEEALEGGPGAVMAAVELCHCPEGYAGTSCEQCAEGFRRVDDRLEGGECVPCNCHGHAEQCDPFTGHCLNCADDTYGPNCAQCAPGFHGDATQGTSNDCKHCACPLEIDTNNFAQSCILDPEVSDSKFVCIGCKVGHEGSFCEHCADGYFGNPLVPGNYCQPCDCHGNADPGANTTCDRMTGECSKCRHNTEGYHCETCIPGYYGTARHGDCLSCECDVYGSVDNQCDRTTGQCTCRERYHGNDCGRCQEGYGNTAAGCVPCNCSETGSVSTRCDDISGQCTCQPGVGGLRCDLCRKGFYKLTRTGCMECRCYKLGSLSSDCDQVTGQCVCMTHVIGGLCDKCEDNHWGIDIGEGCRACDCDLVGSEFQQCNSKSGQCQCKLGVGGRRCDECRLGYYGFSDTGCQECAACAAPGQVCDRTTGECVCPENTEGALCERCVANTWGHDEFLGCKPCECNSTGAVDEQCDVMTGQCRCLEEYAGITCNLCRYGHFGFPTCKPCHCDVAGTQFDACDVKGHCQCDEDGKCPCKDNVGHKKCRYCRAGSFSLDALNIRGCTSCYCFGRSNTCVQAAYTWNRINFPVRHLTMETNSTLVLRPDARGIMILPPGVTSVNVEEIYRPFPLYWALPKIALGDRTLSYNGRLRFTVEYDIGSHQVAPPDRFVLVHLIGAFRFHIQYMIDTSPSDRAYYEVLLREDLWKDSDGGSVTRETFMVVLQNVQAFLVFAAPHSHITHARLEGLSLDHAVPANGTITTAIGVEKCICPEEYTGLSCQNPGPGFYRQRPNDFIVSENVIDLVGESTLCRCHGHSVLCEPETGKCLECVHSTFGEHCQYCAPGYYGNATYGTAYDCQRCACPLFTPDNNFSPTCYAMSNDDYVCDACQVGYQGVHCERCAAGYYGAPTTPGDKCKPCDCNPDGSVSDLCDPVTGQCSCRLGIRGRSCNKCEDRYALINGDCVSCDVGCPAPLMLSVDELEYMITHYNESAIALWPYKYLAAQEDEVEQLRLKLQNVEVSALQEALQEVKATRTLADKIDAKTDVVERAQQAVTETERNLETANQLSDDIMLTHDRLTADISELTDTVTARLHDQTVNTDSLISEAEDILDEMLTARLGDGAMADLQVATDKELGDAEFQHARMQQLALRATNVSGVHERAHQSYRRLQDMERNTRHVSNNTVKSTGLLTKDKDKLYNTTLLLKSVKEDAAETKEVNGKGAELNEMASHLLWNVSTENYKHLACLGEEEVVPDIHRADYLEKECVKARQYIAEHFGSIEEKGGLMEQSIPGVKPKLQDAQNHAYDLDKQAADLEGQFTLTRQSAADPLRAAKVYDDMVVAVEEAGTAVQKASESADNATIHIDTQEKGPLPEQAQEAVEASRRLSSNASSLVHSLEERLEAAQRQIKALTYNGGRTEDELFHINSQVNNISTGISRATDVLKYRAELSMERALVVEEGTREKQTIMNTEMMPKARWLEEALEEDNVPRVNASLQAARKNINRLVNMTTVLSERLLVLESINTNITLGIQQLRESIKLAREQANNIKVSLQTEGNCVRRYSPPIQPSTTNTIVLHFKTDHVDENMLLMFVGKQDSTDFMSVELVERSLWFSWDMGAGKQTIIHPLQVEPASNKVEEEDKWYKVKVERIANTAKLSVRVLSSPIPGDPDMVTGSSESSYTQLNLDNKADLFIGGAPEDYKLPDGVVSRRFVGCVGEVYLDGRHVGLYNFRHLEQEGTCDGCHVVPDEGSGGEGFQFDGSGFVEMPPLRGHNPGSLVASTSFKTFWEDAQLLFSVNPESGDFISLELEGGHVVLRYDTGTIAARGRQSAETWQTLTTTGKYNTNTWVNASATFSQKNGVVLLRVNSEWVNGTIPDDSDGTLELKGSKLYFGGVHPDIDPSQYGLSTTKFLGCMRNVRVASQGTYTQNLLSGSYVGLTEGCKTKTARTTGLHGDGWLELPSKSLPENGDLSFSFRSQQEDALLLLVKGTDSDHFYSFSLLGGRLAAWFSGGAGTIRITSDNLYNDGLLHSVSIVRNSQVIEVYVDDETAGSDSLPPGSSSVIGTDGQGGMYVGGLPEGVDVTGMTPTSQPLLGCLSNLIINKEVQALDEPVNFHRADIGRCPVAVLFPDLEEGTGGSSSTVIPSFTITVTLPDSAGPTSEVTTSEPAVTTTTPAPSTTTQPPSACAVEGRHPYYDDAVAFGDIINSHAEIVVRRREVNKDFNITLDLKTYYKLGLVFYVTNEAQTEYIAVQLAEGRVLVSYDDHGVTRTIQSPGLVDDGKWHTVIVTKNRKSITLKMDSAPGIMGRITRRVDVIAPLYVGGIPRVYQIREGLIAESFKGCMRGFYLNGKFVDIINSKAIMGVRPCFAQVEQGVHFDGFGYAIYSEEYEVQSEFSMKFDFRTARWNGVLMSISHPSGEPALALELSNGQLAFRAVNSYGAYAAVSSECRFCLCDNRWHHVEMSYLRNVVTLRVDGGRLEAGVSGGGEQSLDTFHELFLGGFPVYVIPQGATTTNEFFQGCMKNLVVNGAVAHWHSMYRLQDVHISACPVNDS